MTLQPLIGFRGWRMGSKADLWPFGSVPGFVQPVAWTEGTNTAICCLYAHLAPDWACSCGLYGHYWVQDWFSKVIEARRGLVVGAIVAGGRIMEHETGFRAQYARIIGLCDSPLARDVDRDRYDVPLLPIDELVQYAGWFGEVMEGTDHGMDSARVSDV